MPTEISDSDIVDALARTGFTLEHRVAEAFRKRKWGVISGRYYVDDHDGGARELDMVAYRIQPIGKIDVFSTILISCKKEAENTWAFMSRPAPSTDANQDWCPFHWWTDEEPLATYLRTSKAEWKSDFEKQAHKKQPRFHKPTRDVFAYQLVSPPGKQQPTRKPDAVPNPSKPAAAQNNGPIFSAVSGLLKALHYELSALPQRMPNRKRVYIFHLAVVADAPMVDVHYEGKTLAVERVENMLHLARFIVAREPLAALVFFSNASDLPQLIAKYEELSVFDAALIESLLPKSYAAIESNEFVRDLLAKIVAPKIVQVVNAELRKRGVKERATTVSLRFGKSKELVVEFDLSTESVEIIECDGGAMSEIAKLLSTHAHYDGSFRVDWEFPF